MLGKLQKINKWSHLLRPNTKSQACMYGKWVSPWTPTPKLQCRAARLWTMHQLHMYITGLCRKTGYRPSYCTINLLVGTVSRKRIWSPVWKDLLCRLVVPCLLLLLGFPQFSRMCFIVFSKLSSRTVLKRPLIHYSCISPASQLSLEMSKGSLGNHRVTQDLTNVSHHSLEYLLNLCTSQVGVWLISYPYL